MIEIAIEEYPLGILMLIALTTYLLFFIKKQSQGKTALTKPKTHLGSTLQSLIIKTIIFAIIAWLLSYLFNIFTLVNTSTPQFISNWIAELKADGQTVGDAKIISIWLLFLITSIFHLSLPSILANLFTGFIFSSMYIYFNIQLSFTAIILMFFSYSNILTETNFVLSFIILSIAIFTGLLFFKFKKYLLDTIRGYYLYLHTGNGITKSKIIEFYLICMPYIIYSVLFSITVLGNEFNLLIQLAVAHLFAYFIIYKLYTTGHDVGFDYDPF